MAQCTPASLGAIFLIYMYTEVREASLFICHRGAADLGAGAEKSRRDLGGGQKKIPLMFRGGRKKFIFFI